MFGSSIFIAKDNNIIIGAHSNNNVHGNVIILCTCSESIQKKKQMELEPESELGPGPSSVL